MAGAVFGEVEVSLVVAGAVFGEIWNVNNVSYVMRINHESHFAWQAQHSVMLEKHLCCSAQCK